ncbi:MAG: signal recognition particle-docking protein FtsY [Nitrospirae bacterium]|nr:signal recognition particle-docking protein FtsY [Nitrospirota bacterium]
MGFFERLKEGLTKTRKGLIEKAEALFYGRVIDESLLEELEELLVMSDVGPKAASSIISALKDKFKKGEMPDGHSLKEALKEQIRSILQNGDGIKITANRPFVILAVGVNGVGKTTTIGKLANRFTADGLKVILAAGDTFRAAATQQLEIWAQRAGAQIIKHQSGADPAAVAFDAIASARAKNADVVIIDTAGRLHTKSNLMEELKKVKRVIAKALPDAPHEVLLVVDATSGQNVIHQAKIFGEAVGVTGIALTKLDGTAKGGIIIAVRKELGLPVKLIGVGEGVDDLRDFDAQEFVEALFG